MKDPVGPGERPGETRSKPPGEKLLTGLASQTCISSGKPPENLPKGKLQMDARPNKQQSQKKKKKRSKNKGTMCHLVSKRIILT